MAVLPYFSARFFTANCCVDSVVEISAGNACKRQQPATCYEATSANKRALIVVEEEGDESFPAFRDGRGSALEFGRTDGCAKSGIIGIVCVFGDGQHGSPAKLCDNGLFTPQLSCPGHGLIHAGSEDLIDNTSIGGKYKLLSW